MLSVTESQMVLTRVDELRRVFFAGNFSLAEKAVAVPGFGCLVSIGW
jgi:hypothetical protein